MRMSNGCEVEHGVMKRVSPPKASGSNFPGELNIYGLICLAKMGWSMFNLSSECFRRFWTF